jgi:hypothetical protein
VRKPQVDNQFRKFIKVIQKLYINIPIMDAMQVPTYAKYIRDILNKKKPLPTTEIIKLTEECSATILNTSLIKKKDPGCPTIECSIRNQYFNDALCDLGAIVSVMPTNSRTLPWFQHQCVSNWQINQFASHQESLRMFQ